MSRTEWALWHLRAAVQHGNPAMIARCIKYARRDGISDDEIRKELPDGT